jgi:hypothetical protein
VDAVCGNTGNFSSAQLSGWKLANDDYDTRSLQAYLRHKNIQHTVRHTELFADAVFTHHYRPLCAKAMTSVRSTLVLRARSISCAGGTPDGSLCSRETAFDLNLRGAKRTLRHTRCTKNGSIPDATEFGRMPKMVRYRLGSPAGGLSRRRGCGFLACVRADRSVAPRSICDRASFAFVKSDQRQQDKRCELSRRPRLIRIKVELVCYDNPVRARKAASGASLVSQSITILTS